MPDPTAVLHGLRRDLTPEIFEELAALQCRPEEILGYVGTDLRQLEAWIHRAYGRKQTLEGMLRMVRQDGLISIRRASFELLKKSATLVSQQYARFLPAAGSEDRPEADAAVRAFSSMLRETTPGEIRDLFAESES